MSGPPPSGHLGHGGMAQLVERLLCKQDVAGSNPATSTSVWVVEAPPVSGGDARGASPFAFSSWQLVDGSWQLAVGICDSWFSICDLRLHLAILAFEDLPWRRRPRRRALRGNGLISGRRLADTMARAPSPRVAGWPQPVRLTPEAHCPPQPAHCPLPTTNYQLPTTNYQLLGQVCYN